LEEYECIFQKKVAKNFLAILALNLALRMCPLLTLEIQSLKNLI
jgi:hypothetical protein